MTRNSENLCVTSGCDGCCQNMIMKGLPSANVKAFTEADAQNVVEISSNAIQTYDRIRARMRRRNQASDAGLFGVYVGRETSGRKGSGKDTGLYTVILLGPCPNLDNGACTIYENRPEQCRTFKFGGTACNNIREAQGLPVIASTIRKRPGL